MKVKLLTKKRFVGLERRLLLFLLMVVSMSTWGQVASLELGTTSYTSNTTGTVTFSSKDTNVSALPGLTVTSSQQGQAGGTGFVSSRAWNTTVINTGAYWSFTITAASGYNLSITSVAIRTQSSGTGATTAAIRSSVDGYAANIGATQAIGTSSSLVTFGSLGITGQTSVTFRIYGWGASAAGGTWRIGDGVASSPDIVVSGSVPSTSTNTVTTSAISGSPFCVTATTGASVSVGFNSSGTFPSGNVYTAQLSSATGAWTSPTTIGTLSSTANNGTVLATIPANTATGTGYKIRVISSSPAITGTDNGASLTVNLARNAIAPAADQNVLTGATSSSVLTVTEQSTPSTREWKYTTTSGSGYQSFSSTQTATTYAPSFNTPGVYYVVCQSVYPCGTVTSNEVKVTVFNPPVNDLCGSATNLNVNSAAINGTLLGASITSPFTATSTNINDVWYKFTAAFPASYTLSVAGFSGNINVELYDVECPTSTTSYLVRSATTSVPETFSVSLDPGTYYVRVYSFNTAASTSTFNIAVTSPPTLDASVSSLSFGNVVKGTYSSSQSFDLTGQFLTGSPAKITINAPANYEISLDDATWASTLEVEDTDANTAINTTVYARYDASSTCGVSSGGNITFSGGGVSSLPTISLTATSYVPAVVAIPATAITNTTFIAHWNQEPSATDYELDVYKKDGATTNFTEGFETGLPTSYTTGTATLNSGVWGLTNVIRGTTQANSGSYVAQLQSATGSALVTPSINSISGIDFWVASSTTAGAMQVNISTDGGTTWSPAPGSPFTSLSTTRAQKTITLTSPTSGPTLVQFYRTGGTLYIDDINIQHNTLTETPVVGSPFSITSPTVLKTVKNLSPDTTYYYRVRAANGSCVSVNSNEIEVVTKNAIVWNGTAWSNTTGPTAVLDAEITGSYSLMDGFEVNNLSIASTGSLIIQPQQDVVVHGEVILSADNAITLESDANLVQTSTDVDANPTDFSVIVKRNGLMPTAGYTFWSTPVIGQNLYNFSNGYNQAATTDTGTPWNRFFVYRESTDTFVTSVANEITLNSSSTFQTGRGYAIKGMNSFGDTGFPTHEFSFAGKLNNGQVFSQELKNSCASETGCEKGYNMVGNPYPSNIDFEALYAANSSKIYGTAYFWTNNDITVIKQQGNGYSGNNYAIYNLSGGTPAVDPDPNQGESSVDSPNGIIKVGQGFIVKAKVAGRGQALEFNNDIRLGYDPNAIFYNSRKADKNRFWLTLTSAANVANTILVAYVPEATNDFEVNYDGELFVIGSDSFYSILGSRKLAIQGKADFTVDDKVALGNVYSKNGEYKISIKDKEGIFKSGQSIYLKDKVLNKVVNLSQGDYVFQGVKGTDATRFEIVYKEDAVLATDGASKSGFSVYKDGNSYVVASSKKLGKVEVYDTAGRLMTALSTNETTIRIDASAFSSGVYILKVENSGDVKTKKVIK